MNSMWIIPELGSVRPGTVLPGRAESRLVGDAEQEAPAAGAHAHEGVQVVAVIAEPLVVRVQRRWAANGSTFAGGVRHMASSLRGRQSAPSSLVRNWCAACSRPARASAREFLRLAMTGGPLQVAQDHARQRRRPDRIRRKRMASAMTRRSPPRLDLFITCPPVGTYSPRRHGDTERNAPAARFTRDCATTVRSRRGPLPLRQAILPAITGPSA